MKKSKKSNSIFIWSAVLSIISAFALIVQNGSYAVPDYVKESTQSTLAQSISQIRYAFEDASYYVLFFVILAFIAYLHLIPKINKKLLKWSVPFSIIASFFFLLCDSYHKTSSWDCIFGSTSAFVTSIIKGAGIAILVFFMYDIVNRISIEKFSVSKTFNSKDFIRLAAIMFACWIPYMIILAPGNMNSDVNDQFAQIMGNSEVCWTSNAADGESLLNNHHPVFHTLVVGAFLKLGGVFGSYFAGAEMFSVLQCLAFACALTFSVVKLRQFGMSKKLSRMIFLIFAFCPLFPVWGMTIMKDTSFSIVFLVTIVLLYDAFVNKNKFKGKKCVFLGVSFLLMMLMRNNGFYMLLVFLPFVIIHFIKDRKFLVRIVAVLLIPIIIFKVGFTGIVFSQLGIEEGGKQEMLSIPFQQTARYVNEYGDEVTEEEEQAILAVLNEYNGEKITLQDIADRYTPYISDPIKSMYNKDADMDVLKDYIKVWFEQLKKHPGVYVEAFLNMNYSWFTYDTSRGYIYYNGVDPNIAEWLDGLKNPSQLRGISLAVERGIMLLHEIPVVNCLLEFSFYTWAYVIIFLAMLIRKRYKELLVCLPIFINYAICFIGPIAYMRYALPMAVCLPFVIFIAFSRKRNSDEETKKLEDNEIWIK